VHFLRRELRCGIISRGSTLCILVRLKTHVLACTRGLSPTIVAWHGVWNFSAHARPMHSFVCCGGNTARANHRSTLVLASQITFQQPCLSRSRLLSLRLPWRSGPRTGQASSRRRRQSCRPCPIWSRWRPPRSARMLSDSRLSVPSILSSSRSALLLSVIAC
jgi:hypothetical protein